MTDPIIEADILADFLHLNVADGDLLCGDFSQIWLKSCETTFLKSLRAFASVTGTSYKILPYTTVALRVIKRCLGNSKCVPALPDSVDENVVYDFGPFVFDASQQPSLQLQ